MLKEEIQEKAIRTYEMFYGAEAEEMKKKYGPDFEKVNFRNMPKELFILDQIYTDLLWENENGELED